MNMQQAMGSALLALGPALALAAPAQAAGYILGDSHGQPIAQLSHLNDLSRISVHIRGPHALEQFAKTPPHSTVFLVLGTNDANGSIARLEKSIDDIVRIAEKKNIALVWLGPPCVRKPWDTRARELDVILRERLAGTSARYVSMRDAELCSGSFHEPDGVHLKMKGYAFMWEKARVAAGMPAPEPQTAQGSGARPEQTSAVNRVTVRIPLPPRRP